MTTCVAKPAGPRALSLETAAHFFSLSSTNLGRRGPGRGGFHPVHDQPFLPSNIVGFKLHPVKAALAVLLLVSLLHRQSSLAQAPNATGLSLVIRGPTDVLRVGDEIPIQFVISNHAKADFKYWDRDKDRSGRMHEFKLIAKTASGQSVPDPRLHNNSIGGGGVSSRVLKPGESFTKTIPLNLWALLEEPGRYEVLGTYLARDFSTNRLVPVIADPISITILPRTNEEMDDYIQSLNNQVAARLAIQAGNDRRVRDPLLEKLSWKLAWTCRSEAVPALLRIMDETDYNYGEIDALLFHIPHTQESRQAILQVFVRKGLISAKWGLLLVYDFKNEDMKPLIERALGVLNPGEWQVGVTLAALYYDDAFTDRLIALANGTNIQASIRDEAIKALAANRTDAGVKTLKALLNDPDGRVSAMAEDAIRQAYTSRGDARGRPLRPDDFDAKFQQP
jgi:hypothetical protein